MEVSALGSPGQGLIAGDQLSGEHPAVPFPLQALLAELQQMIKNCLDMPTESSLSWTCKKYYEVKAGGDFDPFAFADKCAELGYATLLKYSFELGGPWDEQTSKVAARHGQVAIFALEQSLGRPQHLKLSLDVWRREATKAGSYQILARLGEGLSSDALFLLHYARAASNGGNVDLAIQLLDRTRRLSYGPKFIITKKKLVCEAAARGDLEAVFRFCRAQGLRLREELKDIWTHGVKGGQIRVVTWCHEQDPDFVKTHMDKLIIQAIDKGYVELLDFAVQNGGTFTIADFRRNDDKDPLPNIKSLKYLHQKFGLTTAPFTEKFKIPTWATQEDLEWMNEQGYQFDISRVYQPHLSASQNAELLPWIRKQGIQPTSDDILALVRVCRTDLLDLLWKAKSNDLTPDDATIEMLIHYHFRFSRPRFRPLLNTIRWLQDHGYTCGFGSSPYNAFVDKLMRDNPRLFADYFEEIKALNLPLSPEVQQRMEEFISKKKQENLK